MSQKIKSIFLAGLPAIIIAAFLVAAIIYAWTEPSSAPPAGNVSAPLNTSINAQAKEGALVIGVNPAVTTGLIVQNGNVGIGTTGPGAKLDIAGNIKIADGTQGVGKVLTSDANGVASWQAAGGGVPSGAVMSFNLASCPSGWTELTSARGRYVVGLPSGGTLAGTQGTALTNLEGPADWTALTYDNRSWTFSLNGDWGLGKKRRLAQ